MNTEASVYSNLRLLVCIVHVECAMLDALNLHEKDNVLNVTS